MFLNTFDFCRNSERGTEWHDSPATEFWRTRSVRWVICEALQTERAIESDIITDSWMKAKLTQSWQTCVYFSNCTKHLCNSFECQSIYFIFVYRYYCLLFDSNFNILMLILPAELGPTTDILPSKFVKGFT